MPKERTAEEVRAIMLGRSTSMKLAGESQGEKMQEPLYPFPPEFLARRAREKAEKNQMAAVDRDVNVPVEEK
jgi:hypothetical protein